MSELVSIVTPCFEHEKYLEDYFESLLQQTYHNIELVFCDDGSSDRSWEIAQGFRTKLQVRFSRVVLLRNDHNVGLLGTLERLKLQVEGDIFCILESDDYLYETKIEENVAFLRQNPNLALVHSDVDYLYVESNRIERSHWASRGRSIPTGRVFDNLLHDNFILTCTAACRTSLVKAHVDFLYYRQRGYQTADYGMYLDLSRQGTFGYIDRPLAVYRVVEGSVSHSGSETGRLQWKLDYYRVKRDYIHKYGCRDEIRQRAEAQLHSSLMQLGWASGSAEDFRQGYSWLLKHDFSRAARWTQLIRSLAIQNRPLWRMIRRLEARRAKVRRI